MTIAVHAITKNGVELARKLAQLMPEVQVFITDKFDINANEKPLNLPLAHHFDDRFNKYSHHICLFSVGIAARLIAPKLLDKRSDPAVICIDEQGHHVVSFCGGHRGGANALASRVAYLLGTQAVITTASDNAETLSIDMMGAHLGWRLDPASEMAITPVSAAVVNQQPVLIFQQAGDKNWWQHQQALPNHLQISQQLTSLQNSDVKAAVVISDRTNISTLANFPMVIWRPRSLYIGIGCDRNTPLAVIEQGLNAFLAEQQLSALSIAALVSITLKADEAGIIAMAQQLDRPFITFDAEMLADVAGIENPSATVMRCIGVASVAEAACLYATNLYTAKQSKLLVAKHKYKFDGFNLTFAACRIDFPDVDVHDNKHNGHNHGHQSIRTGVDRPIHHFLYHLIVCEGGRCAGEGQQGLSHHLRTLIKQQGFARGENRIKVTRSHCLGCCRKSVPIVIYQGYSQINISENHAMWLQKVDQLSDLQWHQIFAGLVANIPLTTILPSQFISPQETDL